MTEIKTGVIDIDFKPDASYDCTDGNEPTINLQSPELSTAYFKWIDAGRIATVDGKTLGGGFTREVGTDYFIRDTEQSAANCRDKLFVDNATNKATFWELDSSYTASAPELAHANGCKYNTKDTAFLPSNTPILIASIATKSLPAGTGNTNATSTGASEETDTCESSGFSLGWITCGLINGMSSMVQKVFTGIIEPYLKTAPIDTTASTDNPIFKVWSSMRGIANIVLIFALLFVVFGQAVGGGLIDAYTAKKIMPRLLAAAILINISIYLVAALIDIFNVLGAGIGDLILGPFKNTIFSKFQNNGAGNAISIGAIIAGVVVAVLAVIVTKGFRADIAGGTTARASLGATFVPFLHFMLVFVLIPAVLISLAIFATLIIRQGIILILVVTAPIAFAFFAIPSTEKYFKKWWDTLISTLMVYPIMTVIFSASIILAALSFSVGDRTDATGSNIIGAIVAFVILIVPLALIPFSFKLAGGIIGNLLNVTKGLGDKAGGFGKNRYKEERSFDRRLEHDRKYQSPTGTMQKRRDIKEAHRSRRVSAFKSASAAVFSDASKDAGVGAYESTESYTSTQRELARTTAINMHKTLTAAGTGHSKEAINAGAVSAGVAAANGHTPQAAQAAADAAMSNYNDTSPPAIAVKESMVMGGAAAHIHKQTLAKTGSAAVADIESRDVNNLNVALNAYGRNTSKGEDEANTAAQAAAEAYSRKDPLKPVNIVDAVNIGSTAADLHVTSGRRDYALDQIRTTY